MPTPSPFPGHLGRELTVQQVADHLHMQPEAIRRYCKAGRIVAKRIGGKWLIEERELERFIRRMVWRPMHDVSAEHTEAVGDYMARVARDGRAEDRRDAPELTAKQRRQARRRELFDDGAYEDARYPTARIPRVIELRDETGRVKVRGVA